MSRPSAPWLVLDLGNGSLKAALFLDRHPLAEASFAHARAVAELPAWLVSQGEPPRAAALSSVLGAQRTEAFARELRAMPVFSAPASLVVHPDPGLTLAVDSPETVGRDRLYAARGALQRGCAEAVVVDVGTALTVDAVRAAEPASAERVGVFLGGAIAPGPSLVARSLALAAQLEEVTPDPLAPALGKDTRRALASGVAHTVAGAALRLAERVGLEAGFERPSLVLTGGAHAFVAAALEEAGWRPRVAPQLVLEGLAAALRASVRGPGSASR